MKPCLKQLHLTLAHKFCPHHQKTLEQLAKCINPEETCHWVAALYSRDMRFVHYQVLSLGLLHFWVCSWNISCSHLICFILFSMGKISACTVQCSERMAASSISLGWKNCILESIGDMFMVTCLICMSARSNPKLQQQNSSYNELWENKRDRKWWPLNISLSNHCSAVKFHSTE